MPEQRNLFHPGRWEQWKAFHAAHPEVYRFLVARAREAKTHGYKRFSLRCIWERARWETAMGDRAGVFKWNNNHAPFYARRIMEAEPDLADFFETRN